MKVYELLKEVDKLRPNDFSADQKLAWLNEVEAAITMNLKKEYERLDFMWNRTKEAIKLPEDVSFEQIEQIYIDGKPIEKIHFHAAGIWGFGQEMGLFGRKKAQITLIYQKMHVPYCVKRKKLSGASFSANGITFLSPHPFEVGEIVEINGHNEWSNNQRTVIIATTEDSVTFGNDAFFPGTALRGEIIAMPHNRLKAPLPFTKMYLEYLQAKIAYAQRNYEEYNNAMTCFNETYEQYRCYLKERLPSTPKRVKGYW